MVGEGENGEDGAELAEAKTTAKTSLSTYADADEYTTNSEALALAISAGEEAIDLAADTDAVTAALEAAQGAIDAIETDAQIAAGALAEATEAVEVAVDSGTQEDVDAAQALVDALPNSEEKDALQERINAIEVEDNEVEPEVITDIQNANIVWGFTTISGQYDASQADRIEIVVGNRTFTPELVDGTFSQNLSVGITVSEVTIKAYNGEDLVLETTYQPE